MLLRQIKLDSLKARKARKTDKATLLTTLYSEAFMVGKNNNRESTDVEVVQIVKKFIKGIQETISQSGISADKIFEMEKELTVLIKYLPKQLSEEELAVEISTILVDNDITDMKGMGTVMKTLKEKFEGQFDGGLASKLVRELLA